MLHQYYGLCSEYGRDDVAIGFATLTFNNEHLRHSHEKLIAIPLPEYHLSSYRTSPTHYIVPFKKLYRADLLENLQFD